MAARKAYAYDYEMGSTAKKENILTIIKMNSQMLREDTVKIK